MKSMAPWRDSVNTQSERAKAPMTEAPHYCVTHRNTLIVFKKPLFNTGLVVMGDTPNTTLKRFDSDQCRLIDFAIRFDSIYNGGAYGEEQTVVKTEPAYAVMALKGLAMCFVAFSQRTNLSVLYDAIHRGNEQTSLMRGNSC